jgi:hypothetical protein
MNEPQWTVNLRAAVTGARAIGVGDDYVKWRLDRMLAVGKRPCERMTVAGTVEVVVNCPDDSTQLPISLSIPIRNAKTTEK